ncbi:16S rRNA (guanine(966)-N(2))-methyltransferase RsmD [Pseudoxanthomonas wuyuanensis]|uniref:Ribosomal RNA small subunit methyltransferase D n=1 Tax=Pseudoxanthomonas wuyuanensis TaxID=1073196 RepID=A0A286D753_9GAMM|nr:16S rRNA (guanine(966)-N(2))-methyltransferase RsmD [Pseudoxanthomonas wuyuanensis]KAF1721088.1 16S rRNA (guanine(966)-N(2))-methyltransferase RsmD [Pseudoxanthomonas wuyuanensis]SOD54476.1 16S rRNA m(2)G-966 methyltransferase [Pseudoxanthomonas wuyuanensis]
MSRTGGQIRIIGGRWRGTRLPVPASPGLRPSSDRVRETLFNWLMQALPGANVLDLFAGTGALGWEALSRGAAHAVLVERDPALVRALRETAARLSAQDCTEVVAADGIAWLSGYRAAPFDIAFLDPPFADGLWERALAALAPQLAARAWVYVESPADMRPAVPAAWALHREGRTREVRFALYRTPAGQGAATLHGEVSDLAAIPE